MKKIRKKLIIVLLFFAVILIYSWFRTVIDKTSLLISFDKIFSLVIQEIWKFISIPTIFISLVLLIVCWNFRDPINNIFTKIKELKYKDFSAAIDVGDRKDYVSNQGTNLNNKDQIKSRISVLGKRTIAVLLEVGDKILSKDEVIKIIKKNDLFIRDYLTDENSSFSKGYYYGILTSLESYFFYYLIDLEVSEDKMYAKYNYKPNVRALLEKRNKELKNR